MRLILTDIRNEHDTPIPGFRGTWHICDIFFTEYQLGPSVGVTPTTPLSAPGRVPLGGTSART